MELWQFDTDLDLEGSRYAVWNVQTGECCDNLVAWFLTIQQWY